MFKINLKIALRNLFKNKVYAAINIGGLAIGLTAFVLLLLFINHENNYDKWDSQLENVYQLREKHDFFTPDNKQHWQDIGDSRIGNLAAEKVPQLKYVTKISNNWGNGFYSIKVGQNDPVLQKGFRDADSMFFKVFPYQFIYGDEKTAINKPNTVVLKQSVANQLYGTDKVVGKTLKVLMWRGDQGAEYTVTGVVADPPTAQSVAFNAIIHSGTREKDPENPGSTNYCQIYARAGQETDTLSLNKNLQKVYVDFRKASFAQRKMTFADYYKNGKVPGLKAVPIQQVHSNPPLETNWFNKIKPIVALSIFLLLVSVINFVNLATAQSVQRAKEVGVKKVLGAYKKQLVLQFLIESAIQSLAALFICVVLVEVLLPAFSSHFEVQLSFWHSKQLLSLIFQLLGLFVLITLLAGFYPAWILSNYSPVKVLKGNYESSFKGLALRNGLVILQFIIAVTFIIGIGVMQQQTSYIANKDLGFDKTKLINIATNYEDKFADRIKTIAGVQYVATTTQVMGNSFNVPAKIHYNNQQFDVNSVTISMDALQALGAQVVSGRIFSREYKQDTINSVVINEAAAKLLGKNIVGKIYKSGWDDKEMFDFQIVGIIKDYNNESFDKAVLPTIYKVTQLGGSSNTNNLLVRFNTDSYQSAIKAIEAEWKKIYPDYPMQYTSVEDAFQKQLESSRRLMQLVVLFSIISIVLSLLGLFALSTFMAKRRTKEIAIRKILGASDLQIVNLLNRAFLILVLAANLISWPIAYIFTNNWLSGFAYRIDMPIWPFIVATLSSVIIAVLTISIQARKAAVNNPVDALKYE